MNARTAALLVAIAQVALMLQALYGGVSPLEWFTTLIPGAGWLVYLGFAQRWAAAVALTGMLALVPISLDWLTRAALLSWAVFLAAVVFRVPPRWAARIAMIVTAVRTFEQLRFTTSLRWTSAVTLLFWIAYTLYFHAASREERSQSRTILGLT